MLQHKNLLKSKLLKLAMLCLVASLHGCATAPIKVEMAATPEKDEKKASDLEGRMGEGGYYFMLFNFKLVDDVREVDRLRRMASRLARYSERPQIKYKFFIVDTNAKNAFSFPDGYIFFTSGYLERIKDDDAIAATIAHEIAHITHKHALQRYERMSGYNPLAAILGQRVFQIATEKAYGQAGEIQADQTGMRYLYRAGYSPEAMIKLLEILNQVDKEDAQSKAEEKPKKQKNKISLETSHPDTENRIINARNFLSTLKETENVQYDPAHFNF